MNELNEFTNFLFGRGKDLDMLQMTSRAIVMFFITLTMIKIAGIGTFGRKSAFDKVIVIMLGAVLSRAVVGASPFIPIICASLALCIVHRILGFIIVHFPSVNLVVKGKEIILYESGQFNRKNMQNCHVTMSDIMEHVRVQANSSSLENIQEIYFEKTGEISIVIRK